MQKAAAAQAYAAPRNVIIQYEQAQVRIVRNFQKLGVTLENPQAYVARYGAQLLDAAVLLQQARAAGVVEDLVSTNTYFYHSTFVYNNFLFISRAHQLLAELMLAQPHSAKMHHSALVVSLVVLLSEET